MNIFATFMAVLIILFTVEWAIIGSKTTQIEEKRTEILKKYHLKSTMIQSEAVLKRLEQRYTRQVRIREINAALLGVKLLKEEKMMLISLKPSLVVAEYSIATEPRAKEIGTQLKRNKLKIKESYKEGILRIEAML